MPDFSRHLPELVKAGSASCRGRSIRCRPPWADNITQTNHDSNRELIGQRIITLQPVFSQAAWSRSHHAHGDQHQIRGETPIPMTHSVVLLLVLGQAHWRQRSQPLCWQAS